MTFKTIRFLQLIFDPSLAIAAFEVKWRTTNGHGFISLICGVVWTSRWSWELLVHKLLNKKNKEDHQTIVDCIFSLKPPQSAKFDRDFPFYFTTFGNKFLSDFIHDVTDLPMLFVFGGI